VLGVVFGDLARNGEGRLMVGMDGKHLIDAQKKVDHQLGYCTEEGKQSL
jgi:hypothetical protein